MRDKTCCFTGHRKLPEVGRAEIALKTTEVIEELLSEGYYRFCAGGALGFDKLAALTVLLMKDLSPQIELHLILPCKDQARSWSPMDQACYLHILSRADSVTFASESYTRDCMHRRNRQLVDSSSACICYLTRPTGGTACTVRYAQSQGLRLIPVAPPPNS